MRLVVVIHAEPGHDDEPPELAGAAGGREQRQVTPRRGGLRREHVLARVAAARAEAERAEPGAAGDCDCGPARAVERPRLVERRAGREPAVRRSGGAAAGLGSGTAPGELARRCRCVRRWRREVIAHPRVDPGGGDGGVAHDPALTLGAAADLDGYSALGVERQRCGHHAAGIARRRGGAVAHHDTEADQLGGDPGDRGGVACERRERRTRRRARATGGEQGNQAGAADR